MNKHPFHNPRITALGLTLLGSIFLIISACGTTSAMKAPSDTAGKEAITSLASFDNVVVVEFRDQASANMKKLTGDKLDEYKQTLKVACNRFANLIATEIRNTEQFTNVSQSQQELPDTILVSGDITRFKEGSGALRFWVGLGAGSSYFDATVVLTDAATGETLGTITVDKNSWALGGGIASGQTVETFMQGAAEKIAAELKSAKQREI